MFNSILKFPFASAEPPVITCLVSDFEMVITENSTGLDAFFQDAFFIDKFIFFKETCEKVVALTNNKAKTKIDFFNNIVYILHDKCSVRHNNLILKLC